jgi:hypothetical protein
MYDFKKEDLEIGVVVRTALHDKELLAKLMQNLKDKKDTVRFNSFEVLKLIADQNPQYLYPHWEYFTELLRDENNYRKFIAVHILARLVSADGERRFEKIFDQYFGLLGASVIVAGPITELSARIVKARPELEPRVTSMLLNIDNTAQKHKDLIKSGAIESFMEYYDMAKDKEGIVQFVRGQLKSTSPKTKKKAKQFFEFLGEKK